ncbi:uncharacterized protein LOC116617813 [Nematostella vectensis]|uniref:uncharacterized protein LOC116617813 n=1 Tax=Nematostella vectensis TaxID=45351 RepID=UPI0020776B30|nr:uncharacterized protein LOC116617813 [Nematostella vectensis]
MIQAVSDSCSVRWAKVNRKVYKFQSLVFKQGDDSEAQSAIGEQQAVQTDDKNTVCTGKHQTGNEVLAFAQPDRVEIQLSAGAGEQTDDQQQESQCIPEESRGVNSGETLKSDSELPKSILSKTSDSADQTKWKTVYGEYLGPSHVTTNHNRPPSQEEETNFTSEESSSARRAQRRVRFQEADGGDGRELGPNGDEHEAVSASTCPTCRQHIATGPLVYTDLMEKTKEELVNMVVNLHVNLDQERRK